MKAAAVLGERNARSAEEARSIAFFCLGRIPDSRILEVSQYLEDIDDEETWHGHARPRADGGELNGMSLAALRDDDIGIAYATAEEAIAAALAEED